MGNAWARISVEERGYKDNILIERLFRSYKWECVYLRDRMNLKELKEITKERVKYYNKGRPHQSLGYKVPDDVHYGEGWKKHLDKKEQKLIFFLSKNWGAFHFVDKEKWFIAYANNLQAR